MTTDRPERIAAIGESIERVCQTHLNDEYALYAKGLMARIHYLDRLNLMRGRTQIWAAAIVAVIARLNFLFDKADIHAIGMDVICAFFGTSKSAASSKATAILRACNIRMGEPGLCREEITEALTFYETGAGFLVPLERVDTRDDVRRVSGPHAVAKDPSMRPGRPRKNPLPAAGPATPGSEDGQTKGKKKTGTTGDERQMSLFDEW